MRRMPTLLLACCCLPACTPLVENTGRAARGVQENYYLTKDRFREYFTFHPSKPLPRPALEPRYCYKNLYDVTCYAAPIPGAEGRLVGWQAEANDAASAPVTVVQEPAVTLPTPHASKEAEPLFIPEGPQVKETAPSVQWKEVPPAQNLY